MNKDIENIVKEELGKTYKNVNINVIESVCAYGGCKIVSVKMNTLNNVKCGGTFLAYDSLFIQLTIKEACEYIAYTIDKKIKIAMCNK